MGWTVVSSERDGACECVYVLCERDEERRTVIAPVVHV